MPRYSLGVSATSYLSVWQSMDTLEFLERCRRFGAAGIQAVVNSDPALIRKRAEQFEMYFEAMVTLPKGNDTSEFERDLKAAQTAGATALRAACLGTRRYETFKTLDAWKMHVAESCQSLEAALPLLDEYKIPLGLENHKDWTADELLALVHKFSSEYFGVCLDFGNNIALLDLPMETIEKLAPYTVSTHVKDIAVEADGEGMLLSEVILGTGCLDLPRAISLIRRARPSTRMTLEMITRAPLKIPLLTPDYWTTLPLALASDLARVMRFVHQNERSRNSSAGEDENVMCCLSEWHKRFDGPV